MTERSPDATAAARPFATTVFATTIVVMATATLTLVLLSTPPLCTFGRTSPDLRFFDPRRPLTHAEAWVVSMMNYATSSEEKNDVVIFGDSACRTAIDSMQLEKLTGLRAFNLGIVGDIGPDVRIDLAKSYLAHHPRPRLVVYCA